MMGCRADGARGDRDGLEFVMLTKDSAWKKRPVAASFSGEGGLRPFVVDVQLISKRRDNRASSVRPKFHTWRTLSAERLNWNIL